MSDHVHDGEWCAKCVEHGVVEEVRRAASLDSDELRKAVEALPHWSSDDCGEDDAPIWVDRYRVLALLSAGDKAEAPPTTDDEEPEPLWGEDGPAKGFAFTHESGIRMRWTGSRWEMVE